MAIEISSKDVADAALFLEEMLTQNIPNGRFTRGTALRDLVINSLAFIFAQLRKDNADVKAMQSLLTAPSLATGGDVDRDRAVSNTIDAILSNWFITRNGGFFARGVVTVQVSRKQDYLLPGNNRFLYDRSRAFYPDVTDPTQIIVIPAAELQALQAADGTVTGYTFQQRLVAARTGATFNVAPATWLAGRQFSPFVQKISSVALFDGGRDRETSEEAIARAPNAISVRNLINVRSIDAVLRNKFPTIRNMLSIGMGEPEMQRDLKVETASGIDLHVGGHFDVYLDLPRTTTVFEGQLGGRYTRPDQVINVFRDSLIADWTLTDIRLGDILRITAGLSDVPRDYVIKEIFATELRVSVNNPFSEATDTAGTLVDYYIYRPVFGPDIQILPAVGVSVNGETSMQIQTANRLTLPGGAHYAITDVAVIDPTPGDPNISPSDGYVHFPIRTPDAPALVVSAEFLEYQVVNNDPPSAQSMYSFEEVLLESTYNLKTVRINYETVVGLEAIHALVVDRFERILCANALAKVFIPVYLSAVIPYRARPTANALPSVSTMRTAVVDLINNFDPNDTIDVSDLTTAIRSADSNVGTIFTFDITYKLIAPDGRELQYQTSDIVALDSAHLVVDTDFVNNTLANPLAQCISDRTVRYMTTPDRITFVER
jgi:hypothetical protein